MRELKKVVGQILRLANQSRPDIAFEACYLSNSLNKAKFAEFARANNVIRKVKMNKMSLTFNKVQTIEKSKISVFSDASFNSLPGGASQG